jgi:hypothetical protein
MAGEMNPAQLNRIWDRQLMPLIEDYFAGQESVISSYQVREFWKID